MVGSMPDLAFSQDIINAANIAWKFNELTDNSGNHKLKPSANAPQPQVDESHDAHRSDGLNYRFDGTNWFSFTEHSPVMPAQEGTLAIRFYPEGSGGIFHTERMSVLVHESGLLLVIAAIKDSIGTQYREMPFNHVKLKVWHDLVVRYKDGELNVVLDGVRLGSTSLGGTLSSIHSGSAYVGKWWLQKMPLRSFPDDIVKMLFEKKFEGSVDHIAIWDHYLADERVSELCGKASLTDAAENSVSGALQAYRNFFLASRRADTATTVALGKQMRRVMAADHRRPVYHLTGPMDAILDPAGAFYHKGKYHVFSYRNMSSLLAATPLVQYVSADLIHWQDFPVAVWPDSSVDVFGIWLGNMFINNGMPYMLYTALGQDNKQGALAHSDKGLLTFTDKEVVISDMVHHDGHTWKEGQRWFTITTKQYWGSRPDEKGDAILLLSSTDLHHWINEGEIFYVPKMPQGADEQQRGGFTEYPYLIPFGNKHVLITGTRPAKYWVGRFDPAIPKFIPDHAEGKLLDHLNTFHCFNPLTVDHKGPGKSPRRIVEAMHLYASGNANGLPWYGVHTIPREILLDGDRLVQFPIDELASIRGKHQYAMDKMLPRDSMELKFRGDALDIVATFDRRSSGRLGLKIGGDANVRHAVTIYFDVKKNSFGVEGDFKKPARYPELGSVDSHLQPNDMITFRVLIDHSFFEVFVNGETFTGVFNGDQKREEITLFSEGGSAKLSRIDIWQLEPAMVSGTK